MHSILRGRSIPLRAFRPLAQIPGVRLISLQKIHGLQQRRDLPPDMRVETLGLDNGPDAFVDTAALMPALDLILTSDTAVARLAASLGCPTWIALKYVPEWRCPLDRADSPWYPSVRLSRQPRYGVWTPAFEDVAQALREAIAAEALKKRSTLRLRAPQREAEMFCASPFDLTRSAAPDTAPNSSTTRTKTSTCRSKSWRR